MNSPSASARPLETRLVSGRAHVMQLGNMVGRTLFPSPEFSHWPPFERLAEVVDDGPEAADPHAHGREEVVLYVLSGGLVENDAEHRSTELAAGSASLLATSKDTVHDVGPIAGARTRWFSLILRLAEGTPGANRTYQTSPATPLREPPPGLSGVTVVGDDALRSPSGLRMLDLSFPEARETELPIGEGRDALVYVLDGHARVEGQDLPAGYGLLGQGRVLLTASGETGTRFIFATVPRIP
jgi:redox-sensitive bicupin YhaK (pirin superfamily)